MKKYVLTDADVAAINKDCDAQAELAKTALHDHIDLLKLILKDEDGINEEYWQAISSENELRIQDAERAMKAFWKSIGSAKWHFFDTIKELKPPK